MPRAGGDARFGSDNLVVQGFFEGNEDVDGGDGCIAL